MKTNKLLFFTLLLGFSFISAPSSSQPFSLDKKLKPVKLQLKNVKDHKGAKASAAKGETSAGGDFYYVKGASMFQPIDVFLVSSSGENIQMELVKNNWKDVRMKASTTDDPDGIANIKLRVYGDFGIRIFSENEGLDYQLLVYASPEMKNALPSPFVAMQAADVKSGETGSLAVSPLTMILGGLVVILLVVVIFLIVKKKGKAAVIVILLALAPQQFLQAQAGSRHGIGIDYDEIWEAVQGEQAEKLAERLKKLREQAENFQNFIENYLGLGDCMSMPMPPGMPSIPSFCPEEDEGATSTLNGGNSGDCARCFIEARMQFNEVRYNLEQLRIIYSCTKDFAEKSIAFGDDVSGIHGVSGIAWQAQRGKIENSVKELQAAYDSKLAELLSKLQQSLMEMAVCEEQFGTPDWYDRYGYMYYEFVAEKYKRSGS